MDHRADIFSLGVVFWELLANRRLFLGKNEMETVDLVQKAEVPALTLLNEDVNEELDRMVAKALHRDPRKRYHTAREMGDTLTGYLFSHGMKVTPYDLAEFVRQTFEAPEARNQSVGPERIGSLIQEEILSLSMMRFAGQPMPVDGSGALSAESLTPIQGNRISFDDLRGMPPTGSGLVMAPRPEGTALVEMLEGRETIPMVALNAGGRHWWKWALWIGIGVVAAAGLAAGGYFVVQALQ